MIQNAKKSACMTLIACLALWSFELSGKKIAEHLAINKKTEGTEEKAYLIDSYPAPLAPLNWHMVAYSKEQKDYWQSSFSLFREGALKDKPMTHDIPSSLSINKLCEDQTYQEAAKFEFVKFQRWAEHAVCAPATFEDTNGCRCFSLKYSLANTNLISYGSFFIDPKGESFFLPMENRQRILEFYQRMFFDRQK